MSASSVDPQEYSALLHKAPALQGMVDALAEMPLPEEALSDATLVVDYLSGYCEQLQFCADLAAESGAEGFASACIYFLEQLSLQLSPEKLLPAQLVLINAWAPLAQAYLATPDVETGEWLIVHLLEPDWQATGSGEEHLLTEEDQHILRSLFANDAVLLCHHTQSIPQPETPAETPSAPLPTPPTSASLVAENPVGNTVSDNDAPLPAAVQELLDMFQHELLLVQETIEPITALLNSGETPQTATELSDALGISADTLLRFSEGADSVGFSGLAWVCGRLHQNLQHDQQCAAQQQPRTTLNDVARWQDSLSLLGHHLSQPTNTRVANNLLRHLTDHQWPLPLQESDIDHRLTQLTDLSELLSLAEQEEDDKPQRPTTATLAMVSLQLPEDVNGDLLDAMIQELPEQTDTFTDAVMRLVNGGVLEDVNIAQRIAHTLKGAGNTVGIVGMATLTHHLEDILVGLYQAHTLPAPSLCALLMDTADTLATMSDGLIGGIDTMSNEHAEAFQQVLQRVLDWAHYIDHSGIPTTEADIPEALKVTVKTVPSSPLSQTPPTTSPSSPETPPATSSATSDSTEATPMLRIPATLIDELLRMVGESMTLSRQVQGMLQQLNQQNANHQGLVRQVSQLSSELETLIDVKDLTQGRRVASTLDTLEMDQYSELHSTSRMIIESMTDANTVAGTFSQQLKQLNELMVQQERQNLDLQDAVMSSRLAPIKMIVSRLSRSVRQTARLTEKNVDFQVLGEDTLIDGNLLNDLVDPLMHILRNAVDHGIESPEQRQTRGKPPQGMITLSFERRGKSVQVCCQDDGGGIDYAAVRAKAEERGLVSAHESVDDQQLQQWLLSPNFSTRDTVTDTSGRGIGLDMVYARVQQLGGDMHLESEFGHGCRMILRLPVSLMAIHALEVRVGKTVLAISDHGIEQILHPDDGQHVTLGGKTVFQLNHEHYPLIALEQLLCLPSAPKPEAAAGAVLLVQDYGQTYAVQVPELLNSHDIVIKDMGHYIPALRGVSGVTIGDDGDVIPTLDLPDLLRQQRLSAVSPHTASTRGSQSDESSIQRVALVVDDSLSARRALVQLLQDTGWFVIEARDGIEAAELAQRQTPTLVVTDLEMPRMNGLELTERLRTRPTTAQVPIIMITSRASEKHRSLADHAGVNGYLTKPFQEDDLLIEIDGLLNSAKNHPPVTNE